MLNLGGLDVLLLALGLVLFLFGMNLMGDALKRCAGNRMKSILGGLTSNRFKGFLLGLGVTAVIQSSSATTVMLVGFVNSGVMTLSQTVGVIFGANIGTSVTSWLTALTGAGDALAWLKPDSWMPILALVGLGLTMFSKKERKKDIGAVMLGFAVLMVGMSEMSEAVAGLSENEGFKNLFLAFENPILGLLAGAILTAIIQSSSASVGILQALAVGTGAVTFGAAIPIIMGQNIGTCITAILSSVGASKNAKRSSVIHLSFNVIGSIFCLAAFTVTDAIVNFAFTNTAISGWWIAVIHTLFNVASVILLFPFGNQLERLACFLIRDPKEKERERSPLDERLLDTPSVALRQAEKITAEMADISCLAFEMSLELLTHYDEEKAATIRGYETRADEYEDMLGSYLIKLSSHELSEEDSRAVTLLLHAIGDFERISDHAANMVESAEEILEKKIVFSSEAQHELSIICGALREIVGLARKSFCEHSLDASALVEPLEQVVDRLREEIKLRHILRLQKSECSIEHGFVLSDILTNLERVSDHCSNVAGSILDLSTHESLDLHHYLQEMRDGGEDYRRTYQAYIRKYALTSGEGAES